MLVQFPPQLPGPKQLWQTLTARKYRTTALRVALSVGSMLLVINHGAALVNQQMDRSRWISALLTYLVPYCVSIHGQSRGDNRQCHR
jgi:hypothetical protein